MKKKYIAGLIGMAASVAAYAEVTPEGYTSDDHIQVATYSPNQVFRVNAMQGFITSIQFGAGEKILSVNIGDSSSWMVSVQNDMVNLKPTTDHPDTNLNVLTSRGTYLFVLTAPQLVVDDNGKLSRKADKNTAFLLRFRYPETTKSALSEAKLEKKETAFRNWNYSARGNPEVAPLSIFDDGKFTYFYFGEKDIPAIFSVDEKKNESVVNFHVKGRFVIVEAVSKQFTLRSGSKVASVFNDSFLIDGLRN
jgi:type IV secretion system protein VirB9